MALDTRVLALAPTLIAGGCVAPDETSAIHDSEPSEYAAHLENETIDLTIEPVNVDEDGAGVYHVGPVGFVQRAQLIDQSNWNGEKYHNHSDVKQTAQFYEAGGEPLYSVKAQALGATPESAIEALVTSVSETAQVDTRTALNTMSNLETGDSKDLSEYISVISSAQGVNAGTVTVDPVTIDGAVFGYLAKGAHITIYGDPE